MKTAMDTAKQAIHFEARKGFTTAQSNEHFRAWTEKGWESATDRTRIDRSRQHLNFEIQKGRVTPLDKTRSIPERMARMLSERGIKDPNQGLDEPRYRTAVDFIITGSHEQLCALAFGSQTIDYSYGTGRMPEGADPLKLNGDVRRHHEIEEWAKDMYDVMADKYGEENIISFVVHLDETTPHIHANILPVTPDGTLSFKQVFAGTSKYEYRERTLALHDAFAAVNRKWGLQRGTSKELTNAQYRPTEQYRQELSSECSFLEREISTKTGELSRIEQQLRLAQTRIKGLQTMVGNLEAARSQVESELDDVRATLMAEDESSEHAHVLHQQEESLKRKLDDILSRLADKREKLSVADAKLKDLQRNLSESQKQHDEMQRQIQAAAGNLSQTSMDKMGSEALWDVLKEFNTIKGQIPKDVLPDIDDSMLKDMSERGMEIIVCAALLSIGMVDRATTFAQGHGGGGSSAGSGWGRRPDEDEREWLRRCLSQSRKMMKPSGQKVRR